MPMRLEKIYIDLLLPSFLMYDYQFREIKYFLVLSAQGGAPRALNFEEAASLVAKFWEICPAIADLKSRALAYAHRTGYTATMIGRKRRLPKLYFSR